MSVSIVSLILRSCSAKVLHKQCPTASRDRLFQFSKGEKSNEGIRVGSRPICASCLLLKQTIERLENRGYIYQEEKRRVQ